VQPKKILIIDDEPHIREIAALSFELVEGWEVAAAASGAEGVRTAATVTPDLILLDVMMPELDGPATLRLLQTDPRTACIPVIFLTAKVQTADQKRYLALGVAGVISKPFDPLRLPSEVETIMNVHLS
jgi:CheY-like chemotaxis protein